MARKEILGVVGLILVFVVIVGLVVMLLMGALSP